MKKPQNHSKLYHFEEYFHFLQYLQKPSMLNTFEGQYSLTVFGLVTVHRQAKSTMSLNGLPVHQKLN